MTEENSKALRKFMQKVNDAAEDFHHEVKELELRLEITVKEKEDAGCACGSKREGSGQTRLREAGKTDERGCCS